MAFIYSKIVEPGVIEHYKRGGVAIGELMGHKSERLLQIAEMFKQAGISCQLSDDIRKSKWEKMCWNCVFNPVTVLIDDKVAKALDHPEMAGVIRQIVGEVAAVSAALKVPLAPDMAEKVVKWTQELRDIHTSMYDDWKAKRPTEIDYLNGYIVRMGRELGIPTPVNEALTAMVKAVTEREPSGPGVVRIEGAVVQPVSLTRAALAQLPKEQLVEDVSQLMPSMRGRAIRVNGLLDIPALAVDADHVTFHSCGRQVCGYVDAPTGARLWVVALRARRPAAAGWQGWSLSLDHTRAGRPLCQCEERGTNRSASGLREGYAAFRQAPGMRGRRTKLSRLCRG